jgi:hypothetical protein
MPQLLLECPHCKAERIGFAAQATARIPDLPQTLLFLQCQGCWPGVTAVVANNYDYVAGWMTGHTSAPGKILSIYPKASASHCPADVPDKIREAYLSGLDNLNRSGNTHAAAMMFRRAIELTTKAVNPNASKGDNLKKRITDLSPDFATPAMKQWAEHIRLDANDATHAEDDYSLEDAKTLQTFAEMFLTYAFTLPEMLKRAKSPSPVKRDAT